jgi:hypothetical protein
MSTYKILQRYSERVKKSLAENKPIKDLFMRVRLVKVPKDSELDHIKRNILFLINASSRRHDHNHSNP